MGRFARVSWSVLLFVVVAACGRTELETRPWHDYDAGPPWQWLDVVPDVEPDVEPEVEPDIVPEVEPDVEPEADAPPEFTGLSCMSAAMCAVCCAGDMACMLGCVTAVDPSSRSALMGIVGCITSSGCGMSDLGCVMEACRDQFNACNGGTSGTGGCLSLAWCLVSAGCARVPACVELGLCYQGCFGAAQPEAVGAARDLVVCIVGDCMTSCAAGLTSMDCLSCLATNCLIALRGCIGF
jgi:hypothetical protein